jgi:hypothetical protein
MNAQCTLPDRKHPADPTRQVDGAAWSAGFLDLPKFTENNLPRLASSITSESNE